MPNCKKDTKAYYKGTEPSPKGLGFCAHAEKIHSRRKGRNGKYWVVKSYRTVRRGVAKRVKRWVPVTSMKKPKKKKHKKTSKSTSATTLEGGTHAAYHMAKHLAHKKRKIKDLKMRLRKCHDQEDRLTRKKSDSTIPESKAALQKSIHAVQTECNNLYTQLKKLGGLR